MSYSFPDKRLIAQTSLPPRLVEALYKSQLFFVEDLVRMEKTELLACPGIGAKSYSYIERFLRTHVTASAARDFPSGAGDDTCPAMRD